jgi:hypothetical protein
MEISMSVVEKMQFCGKKPGCDAKALGIYLMSLPVSEQAEFKALPVEQQLSLLHVSTRVANRYKKEGMWWYLRVKISGAKEEDGRKRGKPTQQVIETYLRN